MYEFHYLKLKDICTFLGLGRNTVLKLCQDKPHNFPVTKVGREYRADEGLLAKWREDFYSGKFTIGNERRN